MNWRRIDDWMKERSVDVYTPGLVVHPTLGEFGLSIGRVLLIQVRRVVC